MPTPGDSSTTQSVADLKISFFTSSVRQLAPLKTPRSSEICVTPLMAVLTILAVWSPRLVSALRL
eukprot:8543476-Lingulodinium_polyedra.AAC.1